jgi:hypothetical protein
MLRDFPDRTDKPLLRDVLLRVVGEDVASEERCIEGWLCGEGETCEGETVSDEEVPCEEVCCEPVCCVEMVCEEMLCEDVCSTDVCFADDPSSEGAAARCEDEVPLVVFSDAIVEGRTTPLRPTERAGSLRTLAWALERPLEVLLSVRMARDLAGLARTPR